MYRCAWIPCWIPICFLAIFSSSAAQQDRAILNQYCVGCHNAKVHNGGIALDSVNVDNIQQNPEIWERVARRLSARNMPPAGLPRPNETVYKSLLTGLQQGLDQLVVNNPNPGRTDTFRRLNRTEYQNVIRDLLAIDVDVTALLPSDESSHGFDNVTVGDLSPTLLERYLNAAQAISRRVIGIPPRSPGGNLIQLPPDRTQEEHVEGLPFGTRGGAKIPYTFPMDAKYDIQLRLARDRNEHVEGLKEPHEVELTLDGERVKLFTVKPPPPGNDHSAADQHLTIRIPVTAGPHTITVSFLKKQSALLETERQPYQAHFNMDRHPRPQPALYSISINGPYQTTGPGDTPSRRRLFVCHPTNAKNEDACAQQILSTLMRRAYRRPVTAADLKMPLQFFNIARKEEGFDNGIEMALRAVLVSPEFLFRVEQDPANIAPKTAYRISDVELASRLSFFLWSSIPDDALLDAAIAGKLRTPAVLEQHTRRMLADPRSNVLVSNFAEQWLHLRNLASTTPDMRVFPDFDDNLRQSFLKETELFFESILREDRNVLDLLRANYTFINERLARHYGIPNIYGSRFRRINFDENSNRGGLLRQGSILTVTSYATRTSPVIRGKWILDNILGVPPPPPPASVPALKEHEGFGKNLTMRQRMAQHRDSPACSGCHQLMDPVGFSLENYDGVGRWRSNDESANPIDASGSLPDGSKFAGVAGLQQALLSHPESFVTTLSEKLLTYGLGRGVGFYDAPAVRKIVRESQAKDFRFSSVILGVVNSTPFQMRRSQ